MADTHVLLLTGNPGVGKTTLIRKAVAAMGDRKVVGFFTGEVRKAGTRQGFTLSTFDGHERLMAHVDFPTTHRVGKYGVDVSVIDRVSEDLLTPSDTVDVYVVDEIGKMECFSKRFVEAMRTLLDSQRPVVATIAQRGVGFIAEAKRRPDVELWEVRRSNRSELREEILDWVRIDRAGQRAR